MSMTTQLTLDIPLARSNRDEGIERAVTSANRKDAGWSEKAYQMFQEWIRGWPVGFEFMMEDFRLSAQIRGLPDPPSKRAFGGIAVKARIAGLIKTERTKKVKNPDANCANAAVWIKL